MTLLRRRRRVQGPLLPQTRTLDPAPGRSARDRRGLARAWPWWLGAAVVSTAALACPLLAAASGPPYEWETLVVAYQMVLVAAGLALVGALLLGTGLGGGHRRVGAAGAGVLGGTVAVMALAGLFVMLLVA